MEVRNTHKLIDSNSKQFRTYIDKLNHKEKLKVNINVNEYNQFYVNTSLRSTGRKSTSTECILNFFQQAHEPQYPFVFSTVSTQTIYQIIMGFKNNKVGFCEINSMIIKHLAPQIIIPMTQLVNIILTQHYFPNCQINTTAKNQIASEK